VTSNRPGCRDVVTTRTTLFPGWLLRLSTAISSWDAPVISATACRATVIELSRAASFPMGPLAYYGDTMARRILFVCSGSTCRSPMAAALAAHRFRDAVVESAGWSPGEGVAPHAAAVVKELTGEDISDHTPRDVSELELGSYDRVIVLDRYVAEELRLQGHDTFDTWDIEDPYGRGLDDY
jgi:protein-tyrosine-phosphatase